LDLVEVVVLGNQKEVPVSDVVNLHLEPLAVGTHEPPGTVVTEVTISK